MPQLVLGHDRTIYEGCRVLTRVLVCDSEQFDNLFISSLIDLEAQLLR